MQVVVTGRPTVEGHGAPGVGHHGALGYFDALSVVRGASPLGIQSQAARSDTQGAEEEGAGPGVQGPGAVQPQDFQQDPSHCLPRVLGKES